MNTRLTDFFVSVNTRDYVDTVVMVPTMMGKSGSLYIVHTTKLNKWLLIDNFHVSGNGTVMSTQAMMPQH